MGGMARLRVVTDQSCLQIFKVQTGTSNLATYTYSSHLTLQPF